MFADSLKRLLLRSLLFKRLLLWRNNRRVDYLSRWQGVLASGAEVWEKARQASAGGPDVLIATSTGGQLAVASVEQALAAALTLRGAKVHVLLCDELLPGCLLCHSEFYPDINQFIRYGPSRDLCKTCFKPAAAIYESLGVTLHRYSDFISPEEMRQADTIAAAMPMADISSYKLDGMAVGEHAMAGALRFYARGAIDEEPYAEAVARHYLKAALLTTYATRNLLKAFNFRCAAFHHGIYVPQGLIGETCRSMGVRVVNWNPTYRKRCFIFSHGDTYHHTLMNEPVSRWENLELTPPLEAVLMDYLQSRQQGTNDWIWYHDQPREDRDYIARQTGVDFSKPCIGMLTNVIWDAQLHYPANAFADMMEWVLRTIDYFSRRPDLQLLIRVHPAEIRGTLPSRQRVVDEIKKAYPELPPNVFVIPPESQISTYAAMQPCNAVIIYGTKTGVELTSINMPVIVAGEAWVRNKGITLDASTAEEYFKILDRLPLEQAMDEAAVRRARRYAFHFFFRRMIPLDFMEPTGGSPPYEVRLDSLAGLAPGSSRGLDVICKGIMDGDDFIFPAEDYLQENG